MFRTGFLALTLTALLAACGGGGSSAPAPVTPVPIAPVVPPPAPPGTPPATIASTASAGVSAYPTLLTIPELNRQRGIRLYVPPGYATSTKRYPVIYMHDAQNLFDNAIAQAGEWEIDETLDQLARAGQLEAIVVGVDRGGVIGNLAADPLRMTELNPWFNPANGAGEGRQYMDFIVKVVKPLIDNEYRTLPDRANTGVMGASLGGLISHYAINQYPDVFGKAAIFSPSYWVGGQPSYQFFDSTVVPKDARLYLLVGEREGPMVTDLQNVHRAIARNGHPGANLSIRVVPNGEHGEPMYRAETKAALVWLFAPAP